MVMGYLWYQGHHPFLLPYQETATSVQQSKSNVFLGKDHPTLESGPVQIWPLHNTSQPAVSTTMSTLEGMTAGNCWRFDFAWHSTANLDSESICYMCYSIGPNPSFLASNHPYFRQYIINKILKQQLYQNMSRIFDSQSLCEGKISRQLLSDLPSGTFPTTSRQVNSLALRKNSTVISHLQCVCTVPSEHTQLCCGVLRNMYIYIYILYIYMDLCSFEFTNSILTSHL